MDSGLFRLLHRLSFRQFNREFRAGSRGRVHLDVAAMALHNLGGDRDVIVLKARFPIAFKP